MLRDREIIVVNIDGMRMKKKSWFRWNWWFRDFVEFTEISAQIGLDCSQHSTLISSTRKFIPSWADIRSTKSAEKLITRTPRASSNLSALSHLSYHRITDRYLNELHRVTGREKKHGRRQNGIGDWNCCSLECQNKNQIKISSAPSPFTSHRRRIEE